MWSIWIETALAQTAVATGAPAAGQQPSMLLQLLPLAIIFAIFYFLILRPQSKKAKDHEVYLGGLKRGDEVVLNSGMLGRIDGLTDQVVTLEIAQDVKVKVLRKQIAGNQANFLVSKAEAQKK